VHLFLFDVFTTSPRGASKVEGIAVVWVNPAMCPVPEESARAFAEPQGLSIRAMLSASEPTQLKMAMMTMTARAARDRARSMGVWGHFSPHFAVEAKLQARPPWIARPEGVERRRQAR
jgi:hypothetical protein